MGHLLGAEKLIFLFAADNPTMAGASVESCQFVILRLRGRLGSVYTRRHRMRGGFIGRDVHQQVPSQGLQINGSGASGEPQARACGVGDHPTPDLARGIREPIHIRKKQFGPDGGSRKNVNYPRAPSSRHSVVDPILPQR